MSLRRKAQRKRRRSQQNAPPPGRRVSAGDERQLDDAWLQSSWAQATPRQLEAVYGTAPWASSEPAQRDVEDAEHPTPRSSSRGLQAAVKVERLAYSRRQAAEALGVSISTIDRHIVPSISTVKTPWGQRLIPVDELERFLRSHLAPARSCPARGHAGRPPTLPPSLVERIRLDYARGRSLAAIARTLTAYRIPTAHGGRQWWPSTVRSVLLRPGPLSAADPSD